MMKDLNQVAAKRPALWTMLLAALMVAAPPAWAAPQDACSSGLCGASGLSAQTFGELARADKEVPDAVARAGVRNEALRSQPSLDAWNRHVPARDDRESYNCALSFGAAAELSKKGFLGTRVLGRTQVWRTPDAKD